jgi:beta-N-acetylhexosaminidase
VVLVCAPALVADSLKAMDTRPTSNTATLSALMGRGAAGWDGLLADARYDGARADLSGDLMGVA